MGFRTDINGLRGIAVALVVLFHFLVPGFEGGFVGVDVFFVISGFLMTQVVVGKLADGRFSLTSFYAARARRIVPALLVLQVALLVFGMFALLPTDLATLAKSSAAAIGFVSNIVFWRESGYFDVSSRAKWLLHTWSLSVEWQFYLVFPLLLLGLSRLRDKRWLLRGLIAAFCSSLVLSIVGTPIKPVAAFFLLPTRAWEMLAGALVCLAPRARPGNVGLAYVGLALIAAATFLFDESAPWPSYGALLPVLGASLVLSAHAEIWPLRTRALQYLGDVSYSLYLWHWPFVVAARVYEIELNAATILGLIAASLVCAQASYVWVETRARTARRSGDSDMYGLTARSVGLIAVGLAVWQLGGIPARLPALAAKNDAVIAEERRVPCEKGDPFCAIGGPSSDSVLVWGDSHGNHLFPALSALREKARGTAPRLLFATQDACIPVRGFNSPECTARNEQVFERAQQSDVRSVIIASIWTPYFRERLYDERTLPTVCLARNGSCELVRTATEGIAAVKAQLVADISRLTTAGKRVFVVLPVPMYPQSVARYMALQYWRGRELDLSLSTDQHRKVHAPMVAALRAAVKESGATALEPADILCTSEACEYQRDQEALYFDNNHLAHRGSLLLVPLLSPAFESLAWTKGG